MQIKAFILKNTKLPVDTYLQFCEKPCFFFLFFVFVRFLKKDQTSNNVRWNKVFCSIV